MRQRTATPDKLEILAIAGVPEISPGAPLAELLCAAAQDNGLKLEDGDILVVAQKVVSKAEGRLVELSRVEPSAVAESLARTLEKDPRHLEVILRESRRIVRMDAGLVIAGTHHPFICANAGVDTSNVPAGWVSLLPTDPDLSAQRLQEEIAQQSGRHTAVVISDTFGRPWREGLTNVAIGVAGFRPLLDYRGQSDGQGDTLAGPGLSLAD